MLHRAPIHDGPRQITVRAGSVVRSGRVLRMSFATFDVRRVASTVALISLLGCGSEPAPEADAAADAGSTDSAVMNDAAVSMDTSVPMDAAPPFVFDGAVPENGAVVFADPMLGGSARLVTADVITLSDDADTISSLIVPAGYVLYGASDAAFGGEQAPCPFEMEWLGDHTYR